MLRKFDKHAFADPPTTPGDIDIEVILMGAALLAECDHADDLCLTDELDTDLQEHIARLGDTQSTRQDLAMVLDVDTGGLSFEEHGDAFVTRHDGYRVGQWESDATYLANVAASHVLLRRLDNWATLNVQSRSSVLNSLRIFLDRCPACDGPVSLDAYVAESCCRSIDVFAVNCHDRGTRLFEAGQPGYSGIGRVAS